MMVKREFQGLQIGILNHPVTVKIIELLNVKVVAVKFSQTTRLFATLCINFYMSMDRKYNGLSINMTVCVDRVLRLAARGLQS